MRNIQQVRYLGHVHFIEIVQGQHRAIVLSQPAQNGVDRLAVVDSGNRRANTLVCVTSLAHLAPAPQCVHAFVVGNAKQPGTKPCRVLQRRHMAKDRDPCILNSVPREFGVTGDDGGELQERRLPARNQDFDGVAITRLAAQDQPFVIDVISFLVHCIQ